MMKPLIAVLMLVLLTGCSTTDEMVEQKAQNMKARVVSAQRMEQLCKHEAAHLYNTGEQLIDLTGVEQYRGSYELRGATRRDENFVCSFDDNGEFLHLSMS